MFFNEAVTNIYENISVYLGAYYTFISVIKMSSRRRM
jgi:hypothetical protein